MRLLFGFTLPDDIRQETARLAALAEPLIPGRYSGAENHHITLAFLGEVDESRVEEARALLARQIASVPAPTLTLDRADFFKRPENGILILRVLCTPGLSCLHNALCAALLKEGFPCDPKPFAAHITLCRHAKITPEALAKLSPAPLSFSPRFAHVFLSARDEENHLRYTPIASAPFFQS